MFIFFYNSLLKINVIIFMYAFTYCVHVWACTYYGVPVEVKGQFAGIGLSLLPNGTHQLSSTGD